MTKQSLRFSIIAFVAMVCCLPVLTRGQALPLRKAPPFEFFDGCNATDQFREGTAIVTSNPRTGKLNVDVRATGVANAFGKAGVGFTYRPNFTGRALIHASIRVSPPSFDLISLLRLRILRVPVTTGFASIDSYGYVSATRGQSGLGTNTNRFRSAILTPLDGNILPIVTRQQNYNPARVFAVQLSVPVVNGQPIRICSGIQSKAVTTSPLAFLATTKALYYSDVLSVQVFRQ